MNRIGKQKNADESRRKLTEEDGEISVASLHRYRQRLGKIRNAFDLESKITTQLGSNVSREWRARRRLLRRWGLDTDSNMSHVIEIQENIADEILMVGNRSIWHPQRSLQIDVRSQIFDQRLVVQIERVQ